MHTWKSRACACCFFCLDVCASPLHFSSIFFDLTFRFLACWRWRRCCRRFGPSGAVDAAGVAAGIEGAGACTRACNNLVLLAPPMLVVRLLALVLAPLLSMVGHSWCWWRCCWRSCWLYSLSFLVVVVVVSVVVVVPAVLSSSFFSSTVATTIAPHDASIFIR